MKSLGLTFSPTIAHILIVRGYLAVGSHIQVITNLLVLAGVNKANSDVDYGAEMSGAKRCCIKRSPRSRNPVFRTAGAKRKLSATVRLVSCTQLRRALRLLT
jgi:hypothetical protein